MGLNQALPKETAPLAHPVHQCHLRRKSLSNSGVPAVWWGLSGLGFLFLQPASTFTPSLSPVVKLKSELDMLVSKCPEEPLEGDMSSPNSTGTQVRVGRLHFRVLSEAKAVIHVTLGLPLLP